MGAGHLVFRLHAIRRMLERDVTVEEVRRVVSQGEVIAHYPDDLPYPSRLFLGGLDTRPLHVLIADDARDGRTVVITLYEPDPALWSPDFRARRRS